MIWPVAALAALFLCFVVVYGTRLQARVRPGETRRRSATYTETTARDCGCFETRVHEHEQWHKERTHHGSGSSTKGMKSARPLSGPPNVPAPTIITSIGVGTIVQTCRTGGCQ